MNSRQPLSRKHCKKLIGKLKSGGTDLEIVNPRACGIDVGNASHYVAVPPHLDGEPVREFACFTEDLRRLAEWLNKIGVKTVAMQSTGVYWIALYDILEEHGIEVFLVNAKHTRNLPGRKTDVQECQWLLRLHTHGLLNNSFRPPAEIVTMRTYWRLRAEHVRGASSAIQRMQKTLTQMNVQLANVISDISGLSGQAIIGAILGGERDAEKLAGLCHYRIQATAEQVAKSLEGNWRSDLLFALEQEWDNYHHYQKQMGACDQKLEAYLASFASCEPKNAGAEGEPSAAKRRAKQSKKPKGNAPGFGLAAELKRIVGVDLTLIDGVDVMTAQTVVSEVGNDVSRFRNEGSFCSWMGLCPDNRISGGKVLAKGTRKLNNRVGAALRMAASTLIKSESYLGAQYRRLRTRLGAPKAITAMAHRLARIVYRMLKYGEEYVDKGTQHYEEKYRQQQIALLTRKAAQLGFAVSPLPQS
jgi:transposase